MGCSATALEPHPLARQINIPALLDALDALDPFGRAAAYAFDDEDSEGCAGKAVALFMQAQFVDRILGPDPAAPDGFRRLLVLDGAYNIHSITDIVTDVRRALTPVLDPHPHHGDVLRLLSALALLHSVPEDALSAVTLPLYPGGEPDLVFTPFSLHESVRHIIGRLDFYASFAAVSSKSNAILFGRSDYPLLPPPLVSGHDIAQAEHAVRSLSTRLRLDTDLLLSAVSDCASY